MPHRFSTGDSNPFVAIASAAAGATIGWIAATDRQRTRATQLHRVLVELLLNTLTSGDPETARHSRRVADLVDILLDRLRLHRRDHATVRVAALLHDMGKMEDELFHLVHGPNPLSEVEREQVNQHPGTSAGILRPLEPFHPGLTEIVRAHHECWDGSGYPDGLSGIRIPLGARVIAVADVFDALTEPRSYHEPLEPEKALAAVFEASGTRFDPAVVALLKDRSIRGRWIREARTGRAEEEGIRLGADQKSAIR